MAAFAPIMVTEIDWAPKKYDATWGKVLRVQLVVKALVLTSSI